MNTISMESHQEQITELQSQIEELESEKHCLEEELEDLKAEYEDLEDKCASYEKANKTILCIYHEDSKKMDDLQKFNSELVKSNIGSCKNKEISVSCLCCHTDANDLLIYQIGE